MRMKRRTESKRARKSNLIIKPRQCAMQVFTVGALGRDAGTDGPATSTGSRRPGRVGGVRGDSTGRSLPGGYPCCWRLLLIVTR